jgi:hypothetical protein
MKGMSMSTRRALLAAVVLAASALGVAPASAHDPDDGGTHPPTGGGGPDLHSDNMTLVKNLPKPTAATQSDLAFQGDYAYAGAFDGFRVIDVSDPADAQQVTFFPCNGGQGDVSVWRNLLFSSVDTPQSSPACNSTNVANAAVEGAWEGVRIFDISDPANPVHLTSVRTDCGSHTHTLVPRGNGAVFVYVSSYALTTSSVGPDCEQFHGKISVIQVPAGNPGNARVVATPEVDVADFDSDRLELGPLPILQDTNGCHDISVLTPLRLAAAACLSEGQIWDISNPVKPTLVHRLTTPQMRTWHSAAFTWDGERVAFGDEWGGGLLPRCRAGDSRESGAVWMYDVGTGDELGSYKLPRAETGVCTMHNFNFVPGADRDILVSAAYTGGTTVADLTDPASPVEIAFYRAGDPIAANTWSSYWHNGFVYTNDISRGVDIFSVDHPSLAGAADLFRDNPQTQERLFR